MPDLKPPAPPSPPAQAAAIVQALNRQFGPHGYNFKPDEKGDIVSTRELTGKEKKTFMSVMAATPEEARLPVTARYLKPAAPGSPQQFRLALDPKRVNQKQLDAFRGIGQDGMDRSFEEEGKSRPFEPDELKKPPLSALEGIQDSARSAVAFDVMRPDDRHLSLPTKPGAKNTTFLS
jgi:hypothetical protein